MVAVASSSAVHSSGASPPAPTASAGNRTSSLSAPSTNRWGTSMPARSASTSGSTSSTEAPECPTMYSISAGASRKLMGTRIRPQPHTP